MYLDTIKPILKEIKVLSNQYKLEGHTDYHNKAREEINKKYGKFWRERLNMKKIYNSPNPFGKMSYY